MASSTNTSIIPRSIHICFSPTLCIFPQDMCLSWAPNKQCSLTIMCLYITVNVETVINTKLTVWLILVFILKPFPLVDVNGRQLEWEAALSVIGHYSISQDINWTASVINNDGCLETVDRKKRYVVPSQCYGGIGRCQRVCPLVLMRSWQNNHTQTLTPLFHPPECRS